MRRSHRGPLSPEHKARIGAKSRIQHAKKRGYEIPEDKKEQYQALQRRGMNSEEIRKRLRLPKLGE